LEKNRKEVDGKNCSYWPTEKKRKMQEELSSYPEIQLDQDAGI